MTPRYLELSHSAIRDGSGDASVVLGIICPQIIFLSNVLLDPKAIAEKGISEGLLSWYEGSSPMLPQEPNSGFIMAGHPTYRKPSLTINANEPIPEDEDQGEEDFDPLIFSIEPCSTLTGSLGMVLCAWHLGDLMMVLDPGVVITNLLGRRSMTVGPAIQHRPQAPFRIVHMSPKFLQWLECGFIIQNGAALIDARGKPDWQVLAAGVVAAPRVVLVSEALDISLALSPSFGLQHGFVFILGGAQGDDHSRPETHIEVREACNNSTSNLL
jgi:hypothetical protein